MKKILLLFVLLTSVLFVSCDPPDASLKQASATKLGMSMDDITISNVSKNLSSTTWNAETPTGCYQFSSQDELLKEVLMVRIPCEDSTKNIGIIPAGNSDTKKAIIEETKTTTVAPSDTTKTTKKEVVKKKTTKKTKKKK